MALCSIEKSFTRCTDAPESTNQHSFACPDVSGDSTLNETIGADVDEVVETGAGGMGVGLQFPSVFSLVHFSQSREI